jgi:hypothetical protein
MIPEAGNKRVKIFLEFVGRQVTAALPSLNLLKNERTHHNGRARSVHACRRMAEERAKLDRRAMQAVMISDRYSELVKKSDDAI